MDCLLLNAGSLKAVRLLQHRSSPSALSGMQAVLSSALLSTFLLRGWHSRNMHRGLTPCSAAFCLSSTQECVVVVYECRLECRRMHSLHE